MKFAKVRDVKSPQRGTPQSAGIDFFVPNDFSPVTLRPGEDALIPSGLKVKVIPGYMLAAFNKSGVATKRKLIKGAEVVDEDYQGEVHIHVFNSGNSVETIKAGEKLIQFILVPVNYTDPEEVVEEELFVEISQRGAGGFGSTGTK